MKQYSHVMSDGSLAIIHLAEGTPEQEAYWLVKTLFELHRKELVNPLLSGDDLEEWWANVHFEDYQSPPVHTARDITGEQLPDRARRHAWREHLRAGRLAIFDDPTIPDLPPVAPGP